MNAKANKKRPETKPDELRVEEADAQQSTPGEDQRTEAPAGDSPASDPQAKLDVAEKAAKESYDRFLRVSAEFENYKKRASREMEEFRKYANESLIRELLPVVDSLERAIDSSANSKAADGSVVEGIDMTLKEILKVLDRFVVKPIDALGKPFDPTFHEAVMQQEAGDQPENTVLKELQRGYTIHNRLLRPSMVVVSRATSHQDGDADGKTGNNEVPTQGDN